jgi:uncharacterized membrane protein
VLAGTLTFSFSLLRQVGTTQVPNIGVSVAGLLLVACLVLFLLFFGRFVTRLRPVAVADLVARRAQRVIKTLDRELESNAAQLADPIAGAPALVVTSARKGAIQAVNLHGLIAWAETNDRLLVMRAGVGDFVSVGQPVVTVHGGGEVPPGASRRLLGMIAFGTERTVEQDPAFAIRIIVDIAVKALSAAINDPTTAVQAIDHLADTLTLLGSRRLNAPLMFLDGTRAARLAVPARTWADYLMLGVTEIREYGAASSIQVARRLRSMLEDLRIAVRPEHRAAVDAELARLDHTVDTGFAGSGDTDRARRADSQGLGGPVAVRLAAVAEESPR